MVDYAQKLNAHFWMIMKSHANMNIVVLSFLHIRNSSTMVSGIHGFDFDKLNSSCFVIDRFHELYAKWKKDGTPFDALDYSIETPVQIVIVWLL